jgi:hypothetical protein
MITGDDFFQVTDYRALTAIMQYYHQIFLCKLHYCNIFKALDLIGYASAKNGVECLFI